MKTEVIAEKLLLQWNLKLVVYTVYPPMSSVSVIFCSIATEDSLCVTNNEMPLTSKTSN